MPPRVPAIRYHNGLSMKRRPQPSCGNLGCGTSIDDPIRERSNIAIPIVKRLAAIPPAPRWTRKAKGWFLEFRLIPVLLWSYTAVALGTAIAYLASGSLNVLWFLAALALGALIQGWVTHAINEIYDWRSGTDQVGGRALSGGSHVRNLERLGERDLWWVFAISSGAVALGFTNAKRYAGIMAGIAAALYALLGATVHSAFFLGAAFTVPAVWIHLRIDPSELKSVTRNELRVIQLGVAAGLSTAVGLAPPLWPLLPIAAVGYLAHLAVAAPPAELARAWRKVRATDSGLRRP